MKQEEEAGGVRQQAKGCENTKGHPPDPGEEGVRPPERLEPVLCSLAPNPGVCECVDLC